MFNAAFQIFLCHAIISLKTYFTYDAQNAALEYLVER